MSDKPIYRAYLGSKGLLMPTPSDILGPYYLAGAPFVAALCDSPTLFISGQVLDVEGRLIPAVVLDFWQADEKGVYDLAGYRLRGKLSTVPDGRYQLSTVMPGDYQIAEDPPDFRCAHIHVKLAADGYKPLTTQLYFAWDKFDATDHWFDQRRVVQFVGADRTNGTFDFVLDRM